MSQTITKESDRRLSLGSTAREPAALLDADETSAFCGWSRRTTYRLADAGRMPAPIRVGRMTRWRRAELKAWIAAGCPDCRAEGGPRP